MINTIEDLSMMVLPFDEWGNIYNNVCTGRRLDLLIDEPRLLYRIRSLGFINLNGFFHPDTSLDEETDFTSYKPTNNDKARMIATQYFPRWFFCPKCHKFMSFEEWRDEWKAGKDGDFEKYAPACFHCSQKGVNFRPKVRQTRFVMVSMETGEICDIPWRKIFNKQGSTDSKKEQVWEFDENSPECKSVKLLTSSASTTLARIFIENEYGKRVSMAEIFSHYIVIRKGGRTEGVFKPVVCSDNNVYYAYNLNCIYIPQYLPKQDEVDTIKRFYDDDICDPAKIKRLGQLACTEEDIKNIIDNDFKIVIPIYDSEEKFRIEEFDFITDSNNYLRGGTFEDADRRLISHEYNFNGSKPKFIKNIYYQTRLNVTTSQIAYSRIDKISTKSLKYWGGKNENADKPKLWYDRDKDALRDVEVKLRPTCSGPIENIEMMPAFSSFGEGFLVEMDIDYIPEAKRKEFMHTFCHLLMKELEFVCGYPIASMNERLYFLPDDKKYGFLIYSVGGASGSYGGISSLFTSGNIEQIIEDVQLLAEDCSNDPICKAEGGSCFGCIQIPETTCEEFNNSLSRNTFNNYK